MEELEKAKKKVTLICSKSSLDGLYPPLILAIQAVRAGAEASVFFTFDGINALKKGGLTNYRYFPPGPMGLLPGVSSLAGKKMVQLAEERASVPAPEEIFEMCQLEGVKFYGCRMTMDMMGISEDEMVEGVEITNSEGYMKMALNADVNMFI